MRDFFSGDRLFAIITLLFDFLFSGAYIGAVYYTLLNRYCSGLGLMSAQTLIDPLL